MGSFIRPLPPVPGGPGKFRRGASECSAVADTASRIYAPEASGGGISDPQTRASFFTPRSIR